MFITDHDAKYYKRFLGRLPAAASSVLAALGHARMQRGELRIVALCQTAPCDGETHLARRNWG